MARKDATLVFDADMRLVEKEAQRVTNKKYTLNLNASGARNFSQPLGKITGQLGEFEKSLEASNARVLAFGASAGALFAIQKGLAAVARSAIQVEKSLADINVILNVSSKSLQSFSNDLFNIAKNTGTSFSQVAEAATELSRQGLSVEQTLKRTSDALILTRLSGLKAAESVEAITAALNSFSRAAINSTQLVSKLAAVDAAYAVSSADLAEAIKRVGSSAQEAGVDLDQLIAIVTSAQQITARGGAVIGNSFKTIFTRIQRPRVLKELENLGIATTDLAGRVKPAIDILKQLAGTYDTLASAQKAQIAELVGGVFQVNVLKASLRDLTKQYSLYNGALDISSKATDEAVRRNEELNKTVSATLNKVVQNLTKTGAAIGELSFGPAIKRMGGLANSILESVDLKESKDVGSKIAAGIFEGIGKFLSGPGLVIGITTIYRLFTRLSSQLSDAFRSISQIGKTSEKELQIQKSLVAVLDRQPQIMEDVLSGALKEKDAQKVILELVKAQNRELEKQQGFVQRTAAALAGGGAKVARGVIQLPGGKKKSEGHVPNYASTKDREAAVQEKASASYAKPSTKVIKSRDKGMGTYYYNSEETKSYIPGFDQPLISPPMRSKEGIAHRKEAKRKLGVDPYKKSYGHIPNFATGIFDSDKIKGDRTFKNSILNAILDSGKPIKAIHGAAGSGKSTMAAKRFGGSFIKTMNDIARYSNYAVISGASRSRKTGKYSAQAQKIFDKAGSITGVVPPNAEIMRRRHGRVDSAMGGNLMDTRDVAGLRGTLKAPLNDYQLYSDLRKGGKAVDIWRSGGYVPSFAKKIDGKFTKAKSKNVSATWGELAGIFPSMLENSGGRAAAGLKPKIAPKMAADLRDKLTAKIQV